MEVLYWIIIALLFIVGFVGLIYPIIPSSIFIIGGIILYGFLFSFDHFSWLFWVIQGLFIILLFIADYAANLFGIKKYGGTKAGIWGSTIGLLVGPFVIPVIGIVLGPFLGAVLAEIIVHRKSLIEAIKIGFGSVIGFITSVVTKFFVQTVMIMYFLFVVL